MDLRGKYARLVASAVLFGVMTLREVVVGVIDVLSSVSLPRT